MSQKIMNLKELPHLSDSISYLYVEKCRIEQDNFAVKLVYSDYEVPIPCANLTVLFIGPGVSITHAAIVSLSYCGCMVIWCGENLRRFYAYGIGETKSAKNILKQSMACMNEDLHLEIVKKMYKMRFPDINLEELTLNQMRGMEGVRMRTAYNMLSKQYGVSWKGRNLKGVEYNKMDMINKAISYNNTLLYAICIGVITTLGYSPSLGFIHVGNINSFVYDIADLYKVETTLPSAFETVAFCNKNKNLNLESELRKSCRNYFAKLNILKRIVKDLESLFQEIEVSYDNNIDGALWDYNRDILSNKNYGDEV